MMPDTTPEWTAPGARSKREAEVMMRAVTGSEPESALVSNWMDESTLAPLYRRHMGENARRHDRALERAGAAHAVIFSGAPKRRYLDDSYYPYRANPHFLGWLPLSENPLCYVVYTPGETPRLIYFQEQDYWHASPAAPEGFWTSFFDIRIVNRLKDIGSQLPVARDKCILIGEIDDDSHAFGIERVNPRSAIDILHYARARKTDYELECMRAASRRGAAGHRAAEAAFRDGRSEFAIHLAYCEAVGHTEKQLPYDNIIALNEHAAVLHYQHQSVDAPRDLHSFLIDAGASVNGYASDITRTHSYEFREFEALIGRMQELQLSLVSGVRAGIDYAQLHVAAHRKIAELLVELGIASGSAEALISNGVTAVFFPHGLGHFLGLQVHDVGGFMADENGSTIDPPPGHPFLRLTRMLESDQVLTVEPGLYFIDMLLANLDGTPGYRMIDWGIVEKLRPFGGIRIEDDVRVLDGGCENLTRDAFGVAN